MAAISNWRKWIGQETPGSLNLPKPTHRRLKQLSEDTGLSMKFWGDVAVRFFMAHTGSAKLIESSKGFTLDQWVAKESAVHELVVDLVAQTDQLQPTASIEEINKPLLPEGFKAPAPRREVPTYTTPRKGRKNQTPPPH